MKKLVALAACVSLVGLVHGQGTVDFKNLGVGLNAPVYLPGTTTGVPGGTAYTIQLFWGAGGAATANDVATWNSLGTTAFSAAGLFLAGGTKTIAAADMAAATLRPWIKLNVWENKGGTLATYDAAVAAATVANPINAGLQTFKLGMDLGNPNTSPPGTPPALMGMTAFALTAVVPEPATLALLALGAAALLIRRRK